MWPARAGCCISPAEDAILLLGIVRRHLGMQRIDLEAEYPEEDGGFTAQQGAEKLQKDWLVLADRQPLRLHNLMELDQ